MRRSVFLTRLSFCCFVILGSSWSSCVLVLESLPAAHLGAREATRLPPAGSRRNPPSARETLYARWSELRSIDALLADLSSRMSGIRGAFERVTS
jgi:hypothetical protein